MSWPGPRSTRSSENRQGAVDLQGVSDPRRALGTLGERTAERALEARGLRVVERNARTRYGEIDLVCRERSGYVFAEVKTRHATSFVAAAEAVGPRKLARLASLAEAWLAQHGRRDGAWRLAVVAVTLGTGAPSVEIVDVDDASFAALASPARRWPRGGR